MIDIRFSASKHKFFRGGLAIVYVVYPGAFSLMMFQIPIGLIFRLVMIIATCLTFFLVFCSYSSRLICNRYRLVILTPFSMKVFLKNEIKDISYTASRSCFLFSFTLKLKKGRKKTFHFIAPNNPYGSYSKIIEDVIHCLNNLVSETA